MRINWASRASYRYAPFHYVRHTLLTLLENHCFGGLTNRRNIRSKVLTSLILSAHATERYSFLQEWADPAQRLAAMWAKHSWPGPSRLVFSNLG
jgi:hypothetical protein